MGKSKTQLFEIATKIIADNGVTTDKPIEDFTKAELEDFVKDSKHLDTISAPDPEAQIDLTPEIKTGQTIKPTPEKKDGKNYITSCDGCGLHTAGKLKSCPTENCKGDITILEA